MQREKEMTEKEICENCGEACGYAYCGKCPHCGGELEEDYVWPNPCMKCRLETHRKQAQDPPPFDI